MKRFISFIIALLILTASFGINAEAAGEITIISPTAAVYTDDLTQIEVSCSGAEKIIFELDGEKIGETDGECIFELTQALSVGNHSLKAVAVFPDKTAAQDYIEFDVQKKFMKGTLQNFNSYEGGDTADGIKHVGQNGKSTAAQVSGKSGEEGDYALYMKMATNDAVSSGNPYIDVTTLEDFGFGTVTFKYDIKIDSPETARIYWSNSPLWHKGNQFFYDGKIHKTETNTPSGWTSVEMTVNYKAQTVSLTVGGTPVMTNAPWGEGEENSSNGKIRIGLFQNGKRTETTREGFSIDNIDFKQEIVYALEKIQYSSDAGENWNEYSSELPVDANKLKITLSENLTEADVAQNTVKLFQNGKEVALAAVEYDSVTRSVTVTPSASFSEGAQLVLKIDDTVKLANGTQTGCALEAHMQTQKPSFTPTAVVLKNNGNSLLSASQLKTGDVISGDVTLKNDSDTQKTITAIIVVRQNGKLRSVGAAQTSELSGGASEAVTLTLPAISTLDAEGDVCVKLIICNELTSTVPYLEFTELK